MLATGTVLQILLARALEVGRESFASSGVAWLKEGVKGGMGGDWVLDAVCMLPRVNFHQSGYDRWVC